MSNELVRKYFRYLCIVALPAYSLYITYFTFFVHHKVPNDGFIIGSWVFLALVSFFQLYYLGWKNKHHQDIYAGSYYSACTFYFYVILSSVVIYFFLRLISDWTNFDMLHWLDYMFSKLTGDYS